MRLKLQPATLFAAAVLLTADRTSAQIPPAKESIVDSITFGDPPSEASHSLKAERSDAVTGGLGERARRLLPLEPQTWEGGSVSLALMVDPAKPNYATIKLWGSDKTGNLLLLFCEGKQVGYRHLGDIDLLDIGGGEAAFPGRFIYNTTPLPLADRKSTRLNSSHRCISYA